MRRHGSYPLHVTRIAARCVLLAFLSLGLMSCSSGGSDGDDPTPPLPVATAPTITTQPESLTVAEGSPATFRVEATGNGTLTHAWRLNDVPIDDETSRTLSLEDTNVGHVGSYDCVITNSLNGTTASATSATATLTLVSQPALPVVTAEDAVLPDSADHIASTQAQDGVSYAWSITNGEITAGDGTREITYTAGDLGRVELTVTVSNLAGAKIGIKTAVVASSLPIDTIFAQPVIHPGTHSVFASAPQIGGQSYVWATGNLTASVSVIGSTTSPALEYASGSDVGTYRLDLTTTGRRKPHVDDVSHRQRREQRLPQGTARRESKIAAHGNAAQRRGACSSSAVTRASRISARSSRSLARRAGSSAVSNCTIH